MADFICNKTCQLITRLVFLTFIILIGTYFFWSNEKRPSARLESFQQNFLSEQDVKSIFRDTMNRDPTSEELSFYMDYVAKKPNMNRAELIDIVTSTAPVLSANLQNDAKQMQNRFNYEFIIKDTFNNLLDRNPSSQELQRYISLFQTDPQFSKEKLEFIIMASAEYARLQKAQSNAVYASLPGNMTDRQVTLNVTAVYQSTTGSAYIDEDTMKFLKKKYIEMNMNDDQMKDFIKNYVAGTAPTTSSAATTAASAGVTTTANATKEVAPASSTTQASTPASTSEKTTAATTGDESEGSFSTEKGDYYNKATIYNIFTVGTNSYMGVPTNIKQITQAATSAGSCKINPALNSELNNKKASAYSDFLNARNMDGMASSCSRSKHYADVEDDFASIFYTQRFTSDDMVLDPSLAWSVPQQRPPACLNGNCKVETLHEQSALIGTPLNDAKDTMVGSILPPFPPS